VAPVFEEDNTVEFYLPKGKWTNFFTEEVKCGPGWFSETHSFATLPLYVRPNTLLVLGKEREIRTVYDYTSDVEVRSYFAQEGTRACLVDGEGQELGALEFKDGKIIGKDTLKGDYKIVVVNS
jgi:alpha-D-xyloside xylohydrolase